MALNSPSALTIEAKITILNSSWEQLLFGFRYERCRRLLLQIARRILDNQEAAEQAVESSRIKAACNPLHFKHEGAFRSWMARILINEALAVSHQKTTNSSEVVSAGTLATVFTKS